MYSVPVLVLIFICWPMLLGTALGLKNNIDRFIVGFTAVQAVFYLVYIPAMVFSWSSRTLSFTAAAVITVVSVIGVVVQYRKATGVRSLLSWKTPNLKYLSNPFFIGMLVIVIYELWVYVFKEPYIYGDDVSYMRRVTRFVDTNSIYTKEWSGQTGEMPLADVGFKAVFTSYYPFLGMISVLSGIHPLILCKTIIPVIYVPVHYLIVWRIGSFLFRDKEESFRRNAMSIFMFVYAVLIEFGLISYYTISRRVVIWIYNSKSDCFCLLLLPLFFYMYVLMVRKDSLMGEAPLWHRQLIVFIIALACNSSSLMGVIMSALIMGIWILIAAVKDRRPLYLIRDLWLFVPHVICVCLIIIYTGFAFG